MHETWDLPTPPDMVTFAKKMLIGGFYMHEDFFPKHVRFCLIPTLTTLTQIIKDHTTTIQAQF